MKMRMNIKKKMMRVTEKTITKKTIMMATIQGTSTQWMNTICQILVKHRGLSMKLLFWHTTDPTIFHANGLLQIQISVMWGLTLQE